MLLSLTQNEWQEFQPLFRRVKKYSNWNPEVIKFVTIEGGQEMTIYVLPIPSIQDLINTVVTSRERSLLNLAVNSIMKTD